MSDISYNLSGENLNSESNRRIVHAMKEIGPIIQKHNLFGLIILTDFPTKQSCCSTVWKERDGVNEQAATQLLEALLNMVKDEKISPDSAIQKMAIVADMIIGMDNLGDSLNEILTKGK